MLPTVHTLSSSDDENSNDSLPDLAGGSSTIPALLFTKRPDSVDNRTVPPPPPPPAAAPITEKPATVKITSKEPETLTLSSDDDDGDDNEEESYSKKHRESFHIETLPEDLPRTCDFPAPSCHITEEDPNMRETEAMTQPPLKKLRKDEVRAEKEANRRQREAKRQRLAAEKAEAKARREAERASKRAMKPGECMKFIVVEVDRALVESVAGSQVVGCLGQQDGGGVRYRVVDAPVPASVTFLRVDPLTLQESKAEEAVVLMETEEFVCVVEQQVYGVEESGGGDGGGRRGRGGLCELCRTWQKKLDAPRLTLIVCGIDQYMKSQKLKKQQDMRSAVRGETTTTKTNRRNKQQNTIPQVTRVDIETALVMAQLECGLNHRLLSDPEKVAMYILQVTKAVAETPFKREQNEAVFSWYAEGSSSSSVRVDKNGVGLLKLWHQQLRQFSHVGVEMAQAVAREYPGPKPLIQAYKKCRTKEEASMLLADIPIRRGAGVLASTRRIGPELSKKLHVFFTATDPDLILGQKA
ncbi:hypothetical protein Pcinc_023431 [Petrolisthes cinctipes]|uniref:Crossover junction endonuclease EME1 n=1 Tax=Petrolisthes cinctipes TaxID=88211 RepID=A0AAE1KC92_PETCI|nr:hypothetical protein Pcinc_023431 [Petrolisthes cinctipes]